MARPDRPTAASISLALLVSCGGAGSAPPSPHVLLLSVDSVRADHLGAYGRRSQGARAESTTPVFDALVERGVVFENARSTTSWTLPSHMALLTGLPDPLHGVVDNRKRLAQGLPTAAQVFADAGYATGGFFSGPNLHPTFGFDRGFEEYVDCSRVRVDPATFDATEEDVGAFLEVHNRSHQAVTSPDLVESAGRYAAAVLRDGSRPLFCFVHWWDPHYDYLAPRDHVERFTSGDYTGRFTGNHGQEKTWLAEERDAEHLRQLYDAEIRFTDDEIGRLLEVFEQQGALEHTIVVYASDHGEDFYEHGRWGHQRNLFETSVRIPLGIAGPGVPRGVRARGSAQLHDVLPTLAALCGIELPEHVEGRDLAPLWTDPEDAGRPALMHLAVPMREIELTALVDGELKAILDHRAGRIDVYDLARDPGERRARRPEELGERGEQLARALVPELERLDAVRAGLPSAESAELDRALIEQLEAMGYGVAPESDGLESGR